jgi:hypothetical protein
LGWRGGQNSYNYSHDPLRMIDPLGLAGKIPKNFGKTDTGPKPLTPIATPETGPHPVDKAYDVVNPNKKIWEAASPYDYTQYCDEWEKPKTSCGPFDKKPGKDVKTPADFMPNKDWKTSEIPEGYKCSKPTYFPELKERGTAPKADLDDAAEMMNRLQKIQKAKGARK